jgi:outer membrane protein assembly factor BamB
LVAQAASASRTGPARRSLCAAVCAIAVFGRPLAAGASEWRTFDGNAARAGWMTDDRAITRSNVATLHRSWVTTLGAIADSTPVFARVASPAGGARPMLFQTDREGTTYALDAKSGHVVWRFKTTGPKITTSTPAIDPANRYLYAPGVDGRVHKLALSTGAEVRLAGFPVTITRMPEVEKDASALNLANGYLYAVTSGYFGDQGPYDGHVVAVRLSDGRGRVFNSLCSDVHRLLLDRSYDQASEASCPRVTSGIWARAGAVVDPDPSMHGRVYVATGNGAFDAASGGTDYGDSVLALAADGSRLEDSFTPSNFAELQNGDADLGSSAPAMLPRDERSGTPLMAVQGGKENVLYLLDRSHLGGVGGALQAFSLPASLFTAPAVWRDAEGTWVYLGLAPSDAGVLALRLRTDESGRSRLERAWSAVPAGTSPVVSNGMVFVASSGAVTALDSRTGATLWSSTRASAGGSIGGIHWQSPIVVDGALYLSDEDGHLVAYSVTR